MSLLSPSALGVRFRALAPAERRAFLAALWGGSDAGTDTCAADAIVVEGRRIVVADVLTRSVPQDADVVVGTRDVERLRRLAADADAAFYGPRELRDRLAYGVPRERGDRIAREHLGTSLSVPEPVTGRTDRRVVPALLAVVLLAGTAIALSGVGLPGVDDPEAEFGAPEPATESPSASAQTRTPTPTPADPSREWFPYSPGVDETGVVEPDTALDTHRERIDGEQRTYWLEYEGPATGPLFTGRESMAVDARIHSRTRFYTEVDGVAVSRDAGAETRTPFRESHWADGETVHSLRVENDTERRTRTHVRDLPVAHSYEQLALGVLGEGLRLENTSTEYDLYQGWHLVRVSAAADRLVMGGHELRTVTMTSTFTGDGRLVGFRLRYTHEATGEEGRFTFQYGAEEAVPPPEPPEWYHSESEPRE